jgi:NADH-quinone oxidoreductase subunit H
MRGYHLAMTSMGVTRCHPRRLGVEFKYAFLGCLRSAAQIVSYEMAMGFALVRVLMAASSLNISDMCAARKAARRLVHLASASVDVVCLVSGIAETNRHPFGGAEASRRSSPASMSNIRASPSNSSSPNT